MDTVVVSTKYQVVIPREIRASLEFSWFYWFGAATRRVLSFKGLSFK